MLQTAISHANGRHSATVSLLNLMGEDGTSSAYCLRHQFQNPGPRPLNLLATQYVLLLIHILILILILILD